MVEVVTLSKKSRYMGMRHAPNNPRNTDLGTTQKDVAITQKMLRMPITEVGAYRCVLNGGHLFPLFFAYIGPRPNGSYSLDRFPDNDGDYAPGNVRWATPHEQRINSRKKRPYTKRKTQKA